MKDGVGSNIFIIFCIFKYIYVLYFFWYFACFIHITIYVHNKFVNITTIGSVIKTNIVQIHMLFNEEIIHLNNITFNEQTWYHIFLKFDNEGGYLKMLSNEIRRGDYHEIELIWNKTRQDLMDVVAF